MCHKNIRFAYYKNIVLSYYKKIIFSLQEYIFSYYKNIVFRIFSECYGTCMYFSIRNNLDQVLSTSEQYKLDSWRCCVCVELCLCSLLTNSLLINSRNLQTYLEILSDLQGHLGTHIRWYTTFWKSQKLLNCPRLLKVFGQVYNILISLDHNILIFQDYTAMILQDLNILILQECNILMLQDYHILILQDYWYALIFQDYNIMILRDYSFLITQDQYSNIARL